MLDFLADSDTRTSNPPHNLNLARSAKPRSTGLWTLLEGVNHQFGVLRWKERERASVQRPLTPVPEGNLAIHGRLFSLIGPLMT